MPLERITHRTLNQTAYERILHAIASGELPPGAKVTLSSLAKDLGVSLMPIREAVRRLQAENLICMKNRRIEVTRYSTHQLRQLLEIRLQLEGFAAQKAARNCTDGTIRELEDLLERMQQAEGFDEYLRENRRFHLALYRAARRPMLLGIIQDLWHRVSPYLHIYIAEVPDYKALAISFHNGMLDGMRRKNPKDVRKWLELDLGTAAKHTLRLLARSERKR